MYNCTALCQRSDNNLRQYLQNVVSSERPKTHLFWKICVRDGVVFARPALSLCTLRLCGYQCSKAGQPCRSPCSQNSPRICCNPNSLPDKIAISTLRDNGITQQSIITEQKKLISQIVSKALNIRARSTGIDLRFETIYWEPLCTRVDLSNFYPRGKNPAPTMATLKIRPPLMQWLTRQLLNQHCLGLK